MTLKERRIQKIKNMFTLGGNVEFDTHDISPDKMMDYFEKAGGKVDGDNIETNGWQVDYWIQGTYKNKVYILTGSAWYGTGKIYEDND
jgi:hypothetical protein